MNCMNKNGFTLVELLAVIIILSLLALLASTSVTKIVTNSKNELYNAQISLIEEAAKSWGTDNLNKLSSENGECKYISLRKLKEYGLLDESIVNPKTNKEFSDDIKIKISSNTSVYDSLVIDYEVDPNDISGCKPIYLCELISSVHNNGIITAGDKYQCKVKDDMESGFENGYYFYVLSFNEDNSINLIMDRNIYYDSENDIGSVATETNKGLVRWVSKVDYNDDINYGSFGNNNKGPLTAMNYLNNATKDWSNIPNLDLIYNDEGEHFTNFKITGKTRLPYLREVNDYDGTNGYLYDHLHVDCYDNEDDRDPVTCDKAGYIDGVYEEGLENMQGIYGYWNFSSFAGDSTDAWYVYYNGKVYDYGVSAFSRNGVRPVITISKSELG